MVRAFPSSSSSMLSSEPTMNTTSLCRAAFSSSSNGYIFWPTTPTRSLPFQDSSFRSDISILSCSSVTTPDAACTKKKDKAWFCNFCSYRNSDAYQSTCALCGDNSKDSNLSNSKTRQGRQPILTIDSSISLFSHSNNNCNNNHDNDSHKNRDCSASSATVNSTHNNLSSSGNSHCVSVSSVTETACSRTTRTSSSTVLLSNCNTHDRNRHTTSSPTSLRWPCQTTQTILRIRPGCEKDNNDEEGTIQPPSVTHCLTPPRRSSSFCAGGEQPSSGTSCVLPKIPTRAPTDDEAADAEDADDDISISSQDTQRRGSLTSSRNNSTSSMMNDDDGFDSYHPYVLSSNSYTRQDSAAASSPSSSDEDDMDSQRSRPNNPTKVPHDDPVEQPTRFTSGRRRRSRLDGELPFAPRMECQTVATGLQEWQATSFTTSATTVSGVYLSQRPDSDNATGDMATTGDAVSVASLPIPSSSSASTNRRAGRQKKSLKDFIPGLRRRRRRRAGPAVNSSDIPSPMSSSSSSADVLESIQTSTTTAAAPYSKPQQYFEGSLKMISNSASPTDDQENDDYEHDEESCYSQSVHSDWMLHQQSQRRHRYHRHNQPSIMSSAWSVSRRSQFQSRPAVATSVSRFEI